MPRKSDATNRMIALVLAFASLATSIIFFLSEDDELVFTASEVPAATTGVRP